MLKRSDSADLAVATGTRVVPLDRARTFITFLVVLYHGVINYTHFGIGGDRMRWLGFDLIALFNDSFFMACMFFLSGLFVRDSLARHGPASFLGRRAWRLGIPFLVSVFVLMPVAYYRYYVAELSFAQFYWQMITVGPWSSGSAWFLWVLLTLDVMAALLWAAAPGAVATLGRLTCRVRHRPMTAFVTFLLFSIVIYLPLRLQFGDAAWLVPGHLPLPIQTSRILLYIGYFMAGVAVGAAGLRDGVLAERGDVAKRWMLWLAFALAFYGVILILVYVHHSVLPDVNAPPLWWHTAYGLAFAMFSAAMTFTLPALFLHFAEWRIRFLDAMQPSAYGIYLLHFVPLLWLQDLVYEPALPVFAKFAIVFLGTLSISWGATILLRKIPVVAHMI